MEPRTLEHSMAIAKAMRDLRQVEMDDARRYHAMRERCQDAETRDFIGQRVGELVKIARKWNRQLVIAQKQIRLALAWRRSQAFVDAVCMAQLVEEARARGELP